MRLLYFGDKHERVTAPENRLDDFGETQRLKTREIKAIGRKYGVSAYLEPGDFFDSPNPPLDFTSEVIKQWFEVDVFDSLKRMTSDSAYLLLNKLMKKILTENVSPSEILKIAEEIKQFKVSENNPLGENGVTERFENLIPIIGVAGNHELFGNNINTLPKTMIGFMERLGLIRFATKENPYFFKTEDGLTVVVTGTHYHLDIDSPDHIDDYVITEKLGDIHIHIVHGMLSDKSMGKIIRHTLIDQIQHTKADLTLVGHNHIGFPTVEINGKYFVNIGGIPRLTNDLKEIGRKPKVLLIDITKTKGLQLKEIYLKSAQDGELVLDRKKIVAKKEREQRLEEFKKLVREAGSSQATDVTELVRDLADNQNLPVAIKDEAIRRLSEKMQVMNVLGNGLYQDAYVEKLVMENYESHEYTELLFSRGFNVLVGETRQGKSSTLRALDLIYNPNKKTKKRFIRKGADYTRLTVYLSNGYVISRFIEAKKNGKNLIEITDPKTGETSTHNTKIYPEVQRILGFSLLEIDDKDLQFDLNYMKQGTGWFLIGENYSAPTKAKMIGAVYGTHYADAVIRDIDTEEKRLNEKIKNANQDLSKIDTDIQKYDYLPNLKTTIEIIEDILQENQILMERKEKIESVLKQRVEVVRQVKESEGIIQSFSQMVSMYETLSELKEQALRREKLEKLLQDRAVIAYKLKELYFSLEKTEKVKRAREVLSRSIELLNQRDTLQKILDKRGETLKNIQHEESTLRQTENLEQVKDLIESVLDLSQHKGQIKGVLQKRREISQKVTEEQEIINQTIEIEEAKELFKTITEAVLERKALEEKVQRAMQIQKDKTVTQKRYDELCLALEATEHTPEARKILDDLKESKGYKEQIQGQLTKRQEVVGLIRQEEQVIEAQSQKIKEDVKKYQAVLEKAGRCPVCFGTIDKVTVNRIVSEYVK